MSRGFVLHVTGFLWRFQWFRLVCIVGAQQPMFERAVGLYTPFWWAMRTRFAESGDLHLAVKYGEIERRYERLARVAGL